MIWNEVNLISIVYIAIWFPSKIMWCCCYQVRSKALFSALQAFKWSFHMKHRKISSIGLASSMRKIIQLQFFFRFCFKLSVVAPDVIMIALQLQPIEFVKRGRKKILLRFVAEVSIGLSLLPRWDENIWVWADNTRNMSRVHPSDQTFITKRTFTFFSSTL